MKSAGKDKRTYNTCPKKCEGYPNSDCHCSYADFPEDKPEQKDEPEASGQEQGSRVFDRDDMAKAFVAGLLNRSDFTVDEFSEWLKTAQVKIDKLCDFLIEVNKHPTP